jgi:hypothetical protein
VPHAAALVRRANRLLDGTDAEASRLAEMAVDAASSVLDAVERAGLLEDLGEPAIVDARAALEALPLALDTALLAVLRSALKRRLPVVIQWKPGTNVELQIWEAVEGEAGFVGVMLIAPYARELGARR